MKNTLFALVFLAASSLAATVSAETTSVNFEKVNQVLSQVGSSLIEGDELFTALSASIDASQTDLDQQRIAGEMFASVSGTAWASAPTALKLSGSFINLDSPTAKDQAIRAQAAIKGALTTPVVQLVQFGLQIYNCEGKELGDAPSAYDYIESKACPLLNERVPALQTGEDLVALVQDSMDLIRASLNDYIVLINEKLSQTQDEDLRETLQVLLEGGLKYQEFLNKVTVTNNGSSIVLNFIFDEDSTNLTATASLSEEKLELGLDVVFDYGKESVDHYFQTMKSVLIGLQNEDQEMINDLKSTLGQYLDMVRSIISG